MSGRLRLPPPFALPVLLSSRLVSSELCACVRVCVCLLVVSRQSWGGVAREVVDGERLSERALGGARSVAVCFVCVVAYSCCCLRTAGVLCLVRT